MSPNYLFKILLLDKILGRHFIEGYLLIDNFIVGVVECFENINSFLYLFHQFFNCFLIAVGCYGEFMHTFYRRGRHRQALDIEFPSSEDYRNLI